MFSDTFFSWVGDGGGWRVKRWLPAIDSVLRILLGQKGLHEPGEAGTPRSQSFLRLDIIIAMQSCQVSGMCTL